MILFSPHTGSGSTYIYGYCDATFREDWGRDETVEFVRNGESHPIVLWISTTLTSISTRPALALAMSRDGSSGGTIRMAIIQESGVERIFVPGDKLPSEYSSPPPRSGRVLTHVLLSLLACLCSVLGQVLIASCLCNAFF